jgi:hypothetical protein
MHSDPHHRIWIAVGAHFAQNVHSESHPSHRSVNQPLAFTLDLGASALQTWHSSQTGLS